ncbi:MAG: hypothetical protein IT429_22825 [Gemmataceae bacterium]|nr:hypothetical protein [Gemmataceae bacterium]
MLPAGTLPAPETIAAGCTVVAHAARWVPPDAVPQLRRPTHPVTGELLPPAFLKHADDQTVAAVATTFAAAAQLDPAARDFARWGVVAAPRFLGRVVMGHVLYRFREEGAWGISPHLIPHRSLHAVSGTLSQALALHGPNFGVGGGPGAASEGLLAAAALLGRSDVPGVWLVLTAYAPEPVPAEPPHPATFAPGTPPPVCLAVALALTRALPGACGPCLTVGMTGPGPGECPWSELTLPALHEALVSGGGGMWRLSCGGWAELRQAAAESQR